MNPSRSSVFAWPVAFMIVLVFATAVLLTSAADVTVNEQPASEGRPITPAGGLVMDATTRQPAVGALPVAFVRSPDSTAADGAGRYLVAINSGFGIQFNAATNRAQQSLAVIDLNARPAPQVIQNVYFPSPQSANAGLVFSPRADANGNYTLYVSGGVENKIWVFRFRAGAIAPVTPGSPGPNTRVEAPYIDLDGFATAAPSPRINNNYALVYPAGLAISPDGDTLYVANNLGDSLGIIGNLRGERTLVRCDLRRAGSAQFIYPYGVIALSARGSSETSKVYVSCWADASIAVVDPRRPEKPIAYVPVERHPTAMILNAAGSRLYVVNSNADSVSVIDTASDREIERINVRLSEKALIGHSPESLALSADGASLYVANAHSNAVAVVALSAEARGASIARGERDEREASRRKNSARIDSDMDSEWRVPDRSRVRGFIPTGQYPSAIAVANRTIFIGNGKGTGVEPSSVVVNNSGRAPNTANDRFPAGTGRIAELGGQYSVSVVSGNISAVAEPDERALARYTQQVMRNDGLIGGERKRLFQGPSPIKHIIYVIKENRTYDQVFGDVAASGDGRAADGDARLAIFGAGEAAQIPGGTAQNITPNHRSLALRFGLLDRFFVNAEASPDGHNWSTAAFSNDFVDKAYRWGYSGRGRTYDYEGYNRLPEYRPRNDGSPPMFSGPVTAQDVSNFIRRYIPYLNGARDAGEPETLYLWDAAARARLTYRNYGEFIATLSADNITAININRQRPYPDISPTVSAFPTKKSLEGHHSATFRNFDMRTPDSMTTGSYRAAKESGEKVDPLINRSHADERFRGTSRLGEWLEEFRGYVAAIEAGQPDQMPNFSMMRLSNDHTNGYAADFPTPQFYVAENDYAIGRLVEAVSNSPYWKDTAIFIVEDDAQDGPDHVDTHRSVALVISAYNRAGALIHEFHSTVSLIRTMEMLLGIEPMNQLDAAAVPIDIFQDRADLRPYKAILPEVALANLLVPASAAREPAHAYWMKRTAEQNLSQADMADARALNQIIWF
ncbi:MAG TPA: bifunctional YncE family protein/alkaline phosphatase family protein, partial [Blastocatellia bacterium]